LDLYSIINAHAHALQVQVRRHPDNATALTPVRSKENPAELMTKELEMNQHRYFVRRKLRVGL
jgi:hypothetical protein